MDCHGRIEQRVREINTPKGFSFKKLMRRNLRYQPQLYYSLLHIMKEYTYGRIDHRDMHNEVSRLFSVHPEVIELFGECFPQENSTKRVNEHDSTEMLRSAKKSKTEEDSSKAKTAFHPTSNASTSYASDYTQSPCFSGCYSEWEAVASCSSSSQSPPRNAAVAYDAQKNEIAAFIDGTLYLTETKTRLVDGPQAYEHLTELVNQIREKRIDTYVIMERASNLLQGYPELIESFNEFLPEGFRIVTLSDDDDMSTN